MADVEIGQPPAGDAHVIGKHPESLGLDLADFIEDTARFGYEIRLPQAGSSADRSHDRSQTRTVPGSQSSMRWMSRSVAARARSTHSSSVACHKAESSLSTPQPKKGHTNQHS